jgi:exopolyphosphatase/guanosine-5'-triphosphate,3'-diphosphate pyrophosphatase
VRIAAIDIGTNSIHMVIADATAAGGFDVVDREREVTQIGRGSFRTGMLQGRAMRRTVEALESFVLLARRMNVERILCTATAAVREARNGGRFLQAARERAGIVPRVIPAEEEGRLIYQAVRSAVTLTDEPAMVIDIGGGSAQFVVGTHDRLRLATSAPLGALRLTEEFLASDPPTDAELHRLERAIRRRAKEPLAAVAGYEPVRLYGSSGSIHALAELAYREDKGETLDHLNGFALTTAQVKKLARRLGGMTIEQRHALPCIDQRRAEIILPGALVLLHVLEELGLDEIVITDFGVREGLVTDWITTHAREISADADVRDLPLRSVLALLRKFQPDEAQLKHARHIAELALALFDGLRSEHGLGDAERRLFHYGTLLHDIGETVGYDGHAEHSAYLIRHGGLRDLDPDEVEMIALVARYHSTGRPKKRHSEVRALDKRRRRMLRWFAAMLRIVEGLDRSHYQLVRGLRVVRRGDGLTVRVDARRGAGLELWAARRRTDALERLLGMRVRVEPEAPADPLRRTLARDAAAAARRPLPGVATPEPERDAAPRAEPIVRAAVRTAGRRSSQAH